MLLASLREAGAQDQVAALLARDPAAHVPLGYPFTLAMLLDRLREAARAGPGRRTSRPGAAHASLPDLRSVTSLLNRLREADTQDQVAVLAARAAAHVPSTTRTAWLAAGPSTGGRRAGPGSHPASP